MQRFYFMVSGFRQLPGFRCGDVDLRVLHLFVLYGHLKRCQSIENWGFYRTEPK